MTEANLYDVITVIILGFAVLYYFGLPILESLFNLRQQVKEPKIIYEYREREKEKKEEGAE